MRDARIFKQDEALPFPVLVDDLEGRVHQVYGGLAHPAYLIDSEGRVAFYSMWAYAPTLHKVIETLLQKGSRGIVKGGIDRLPHLAPSTVHGWRGIQRGLPQSYDELQTAAPGVGFGLRLAYQNRRLLEPVFIRATPIPLPVRIAIWAGVAFAVIFIIRRLSIKRRR
jgi:hypothetical protein